MPADERFTATKKDSQGIRRLLQAKSSSLGAVVTRVPQEFDAAGNVTAHGNLLTEYSSIEMDRLPRDAHKPYSTAIAEGDALPPTPFNVTQLGFACGRTLQCNKEIFPVSSSLTTSKIFIVGRSGY